MAASAKILHYVGYDDDRGGIISVVRNLAAVSGEGVVLGVNPGFVQQRTPPLPVLELPLIAGEKISPLNFWRARAVARAVQGWLQADPGRIFHGHSRAGLLVALWLNWLGVKRVVVSVHCYGRQRWFYRWAERQLGGRLYWLSPAMKKYYYGPGVAGWEQCVPGCVASTAPAGPRPPRDGLTIRLGGIGALVRWKNWSLLLAALAQLPPETRQRFRFRHIGAEDGSADSRAAAAEWRAQSVAPELPGLVEWQGWRASSADFLQETDCLVVASHQEPFSMAMLEALQAGVPVLAADSGGARDLVGAGRNGWLFRSGDANDLVQQLEELGTDAGLASVIIDPESLRRFTAPVVRQQWEKIYGQLVPA